MRSLPATPFPPGQTLLFDADDTLWENNIYFEQAIAGFVTLVAHPTLSSAQVRQHFNQLEHCRVRLHGYGTRSFRLSMAACLQQLHERGVTDHEHDHLDSLADSIISAPMVLLPGVQSTLTTLATRHQLLLITKGNTEEQLDKLSHSGLATLFTAVEVLPEKHREAYEELRHRHRLDVGTTWMLGNSPKSDINPALAAGLNAVFLPHSNTWVLEHEDLIDASPGQQLFRADRFTDLLQLF